MPQITIRPQNEYIAHVDSKKRVVVRSGAHSVYRVREYPDGHLVFMPCEITPSRKIKQETVRQIERSLANLKRGRVSEAIDISAAIKLFRK